MADYPTIRGLRVKYLSADPSTATEGEVWYNSTSGTLKTSLLMGAWSSGGTLPTAMIAAATLGTQTAALTTSGYGYPSSPDGIPQTFIYNGASWAAGGAITGAFYAGGDLSETTVYNVTEEYSAATSAVNYKTITTN